MADPHHNGDDVHALTARLLLGKDTVTPDERRLGKTINYGVIYGMTDIYGIRSLLEALPNG